MPCPFCNPSILPAKKIGCGFVAYEENFHAGSDESDAGMFRRSAPGRDRRWFPLYRWPCMSLPAKMKKAK